MPLSSKFPHDLTFLSVIICSHGFFSANQRSRSYFEGARREGLAYCRCVCLSECRLGASCGYRCGYRGESLGPSSRRTFEQVILTCQLLSFLLFFAFFIWASLAVRYWDFGFIFTNTFTASLFRALMLSHLFFARKPRRLFQLQYIIFALSFRCILDFTIMTYRYTTTHASVRGYTRRWVFISALKDK